MKNIIKQNSYLVLGLYASANPREINKRGKEILRRLHIGDVPEYDSDVEIFFNYRNKNNVKDAIQRLLMPKKKIVDALFWFDIADDKDKEAIGFLHDTNQAIGIWSEYLGKETPKSILHVKNLAILYSVLLYTPNGRDYLEESIKTWKLLFNSEKFWKAFFNSFKMHHEIEISSEMLTDLRKKAPELLADIYTELATLHNDKKFISEYQEEFRTKGKKIEKEILNPIYEKINKAVVKLEKMDISADGIFDKSEAMELKKNIKSIQNELNKALEVGFYNDSKVKVMRDRAADAIKKITLDLNNNLQEYKKSVFLLEIAIKICGTESQKNSIEESLEIIKQNYEDEKKNPINHCHFCQKRINNQETSLSEKMYKVTDTEQKFSGKRVHYLKYDLTIPRCVDCADFHKNNGSKYTKIGLGIGLATGVLISIFNEFEFLGLVFMTIFLIVVAISIFGAIANRKGTDKIKSINYKNQFLPYKEMLDNGWHIGESPPT